ncbi:MAG: hypothetical protein QOG85_2127, partial [Gaiellaceae bacterium]|nr:hypothetical protein [Gaiellaceae bacterium]
WVMSICRACDDPADVGRQPRAFEELLPPGQYAVVVLASLVPGVVGVALAVLRLTDSYADRRFTKSWAVIALVGGTAFMYLGVGGIVQYFRLRRRSFRAESAA